MKTPSLSTRHTPQKPESANAPAYGKSRSGASLALKGQKVLIVGGSAGIGWAVARLAARRGASLVIASRHASGYSETLQPQLATRAHFQDLDITNEDARKCVTEELGLLDHLVITVRSDRASAPFLETTLEDAKEAFEVKYWGVYGLIQAVHPRMAANGSITLTSGIAGEKVIPGASSMAVINSATETLCRQLAVELAPLRINVVSPGFVAPKPDSIEDQARGFPQARLATADDLAMAYVELMTAPYRTGTVVVVDGGARLV